MFFYPQVSVFSVCILGVVHKPMNKYLTMKFLYLNMFSLAYMYIGNRFISGMLIFDIDLYAWKKEMAMKNTTAWLNL